MLRAPIWTTSAYSWIASACWASSSSVTTGRPVLGLGRITNWPWRPLKANGEVRGFNAPPRASTPGIGDRASATASLLRVSTVQGPAIRQKVSPPPTRRPATSITVGSW